MYNESTLDRINIDFSGVQKMALSGLASEVIDTICSYLDGESLIKLACSGDKVLKFRFEACKSLDLRLPASLGSFPLSVLQSCTQLLSLRLGYLKYAEHCRLRGFDSTRLPTTLKRLDLCGAQILASFHAPMSDVLPNLQYLRINTSAKCPLDTIKSLPRSLQVFKLENRFYPPATADTFLNLLDALPPSLSVLAIASEIILMSQIIHFPDTLTEISLELRLTDWQPLSRLPSSLKRLKLSLSSQHWSCDLEHDKFWPLLPKQLEVCDITDRGVLAEISLISLPKSLKYFACDMKKTLRPLPTELDFFEALPNLETLLLIQSNRAIHNALRSESVDKLPTHFKRITLQGECSPAWMSKIPNSVTFAKFRDTSLKFDASLQLPPNLLHLEIFKQSQPIALNWPANLTHLDMPHSILDDQVSSLPAGLVSLSIACNGLPSARGFKLLPRGLKLLHLGAIQGHGDEDRFLFYDPDTASDLPPALESLMMSHNGRMFGDVLMKWWQKIPRNLPLKLICFSSNSECSDVSTVPYLHPSLESIELSVDSMELAWIQEFFAKCPRRLGALSIRSKLPVFYTLKTADLLLLPRALRSVAVPTSEEHLVKPILDELGINFI